MKKIIVVVILLGIACLCFTFLLPYKNRPVKIKELNYDSLFNDKNRAHLNSAARFGIKRTLKNRKEVNDVKEGFVHIKDNRHYSIAKLTHSIPYLTDGAAEMLDMIGKNFLDSLESKGLNPQQDYRHICFEDARGYKETTEIWQFQCSQQLCPLLCNNI